MSRSRKTRSHESPEGVLHLAGCDHAALVAAGEALLACQCMAESDEAGPDLAGSPEAHLWGALPVRTEAIITRTTSLAPGVLALEVALAADVRYVAGQYAELALSGVEELISPRCYSFAEAPGKTSPRRALFHVRHVPGGAFTSWLFAADRVGARLAFSGPHGGFRYHESDRPLLCVAADTGLAPIKAILEQGLSEGLSREVTLVIGARVREELHALDQLATIVEGWQGLFDFVPVLSQEPASSEWIGRRGNVTDYLRERLAELSRHAAYLCGPPGMIDASIDVLAAAIPREHLHCERFVDRCSLAAP